jgi:hypothetical protein
MRSYGPHLFFFLLILAAALTLACGSSPRILQSVSLTPESATASSANGSVQFTDFAYYNTHPSQVKNQAASWGACFQGAGTSGVTVSTAGLAQCTGVAGTYEVFAFVPDPNFRGVCALSANPCAGSCGGAVGTATLTCP